MIITQFIKQLNRTEVGEGPTNDSYAAIPKEVEDILKRLCPPGRLSVTDIPSGLVYNDGNIRLVDTGPSNNDQIRISGLGAFFAKNSVSAGDKFIFEIHSENEENKYFIGLEKRSHVIMFQRYTGKCDGMDILNLDRFKINCIRGVFPMRTFYQGKEKKVEVIFKYDKKKKVTSPDKTAFYDIKADGYSILSDFDYQDYGELDLTDRVLRKVCTYEMNIYQISLT